MDMTDRNIKPDVNKLKRSQLEDVARHRDKLRKSPQLSWLFFEITNRCNLFCRHCGSGCISDGTCLSVDDVKKTLDSIRCNKPMVCLTGGEPMLHPSFFEIAECVKLMDFSWGMTTNATLIDDSIADRLKKAGLATVSVSLDGMESSHDTLRQEKGAWLQAVHGLKALHGVGIAPQVTTVVHQRNIDELDALYDFLCGLDIKSWRPINVEPIGRTCETHDLMLDHEQFSYLLSYIREKRFDQNCSMEVTFGCSHFLGVENERMVRDHYFLCGAGILTASVRSNGDICACLDIENRRNLVQGNISTDDFMEVWLNRFGVFRRDRTVDSRKCEKCPERYICGGDSTHTWDFDQKEPMLCYLEGKII